MSVWSNENIKKAQTIEIFNKMGGENNRKNENDGCVAVMLSAQT